MSEQERDPTIQQMGADDPPTSEGLIRELPLIAMYGGAIIFPMMPPSPPFMPPYLAFQGGRAVAAVEAAMTGDRLVGLVQLRQEPQPDKEYTLDDFYPVGTMIHIIRYRRGEEGAFLIVQGQARIQLLEITQQQPYLKARVRLLEDQVVESLELEGLVRAVRTQFARMVKLSPNLQDEIVQIADQIGHPGRLADFIATVTDLPTEQKQSILEAVDVTERLQRLSRMLAHEINVLEIGAQIQHRAQEEMTEDQRKYWLRQQLKQIRRELGEEEDESAEIEELRQRLEQANLPEEAHKAVERELNRLQRMSPAAAEYTVTRTYIETILELPWNESTEDRLDVHEARAILNEDHYGLEQIKERILEYLAVRQLRKEMRGPILCFVGPPGVGKTSLGRSIARALGRKFYRMSLGGLHDEAEIRGHRRTYIGALPGRIIQGLRNVGSNNPVFMLDEIDKLGRDFRGDPASALLEVLDPEQNHSFVDNYLEVPFDLSKVMFIATANILDTIPPALLDRMEVLRIPGYTHEEKIAIAKRYLVPRQRAEHGLSEEQIHFTDEAISKIVREYTREAGVRNLEREIGTVVRKVAFRIVEGSLDRAEITSETIPEYLGPRKVFEEIAERVDEPGIVTGLAWTATGGDILFVEATKMPGRGRLITTGQLGEVMRESAQAALSYARANSKRYGIPARFWERHDLHIHVPAGATPKDGPSAGIAMTTALISLATGRRVKPFLAMTGEVTLRGKVLPVGGIKEKVLAAKRAGVQTVILPKHNEGDLTDVPDYAKEGLQFVLVERISEALEVALEPTPVADPNEDLEELPESQEDNEE
ncbi:MAG: Lon protease [Candidatus Poribacteria bacterium]|nr:MAG: Lon protease [Candidatus Poribacteria bacterium]